MCSLKYFWPDLTSRRFFPLGKVNIVNTDLKASAKKGKLLFTQKVNPFLSMYIFQKKVTLKIERAPVLVLSDDIKKARN